MPSSPSYAIVDAANGGAAGFYFLPPLAPNANVAGVFQSGLEPSMEVCLLDGNPSKALNPNWEDVACTQTVVTRFPAGSATEGGGNYAFSWDTSDGATGNILPMEAENAWYRIRILLNGSALGHLDVNPQVPKGSSPSDKTPDLYAFRLGETLPVKFVITSDAPCTDVEGYVIQCAASAVVDQTGGSVTLDATQPGWSQLIVSLYPGVLPGNLSEVTVTIERIDPVLYEQANPGTYCIPGLGGLGTTFDAPLFGQCLRVTTDPELPGPLSDYSSGIPGGLIELCIDPTALPAQVKFNEEQDLRLQMIRYHEGTPPVTQGLSNTFSSCPGDESQASSLLTVPEKGLFRFAALGINAVARLMGPTTLSAHGAIRLAGATSEFSIFRWGLPGQMESIFATDTIIQNNETSDIDVTVKVVDSGSPDLGLPPSAIEGATVHFSDGQDAVTNVAGEATVTWTVPAGAGTHTLNAAALGLLDYAVPDHANKIEFTPATISFTATVVGAPASVQTTGTLPGDGALVASAWSGIGATVTDQYDIPATDANVVWSQQSPGCVVGDEDVCGTVVVNPDGTITWTLGKTPGPNTLTGTVAGANPPVTTQVTVTTAAAAADHIVITPLAEPVVVGATYTMTGMAQDQYNNDRPGDALTWTANAGGGSTSGADWTLGTVAGDINTITAAVATNPAVSATYDVTPEAGAPDAVTITDLTGPLVVGTQHAMTGAVTDQYGNVRSGEALTWTATAGTNGSTTGANWTLGTVADEVNTVTATVDADPLVTQSLSIRPVADVADHVVINALTDSVVGTQYPMTGMAQDQYDNDRPGDVLTWAWTAGTNGGVSGADWTLGIKAGELNTITAAVSTSPAVTASYSVTAVADVADKVFKVSGDGQTGFVNKPLANPLVVKVTDRYDNDILPTPPVSWSAPGSAVSTAAPYIWTLGSTGNFTYSATATVPGGSQSATFTATSLCHPDINGVMAPNEWACASAVSDTAHFVANISGGSTPAEVWWMNDADSLYLMVRVMQPSFDKANSVRFDFDNGNGVHDENDDAIGFDVSGGFYDEYLTKKCANSSQSGCGSTDSGGAAGQNGQAEAQNDGTWTTYELSHPLSGGGVQDFSLVVRQQLGFFLSLQNGNGAQGNTQFPGFRSFKRITIR